MHNTLPCRVTFVSRHVKVSGQCQIRNSGAEDVLNIHCSYVLQEQSKFGKTLGLELKISEACDHINQSFQLWAS
jgi:hypothetical protein